MYKTYSEQKHELLHRLLVLIFGVAILLTIGMFVFHYSEGWSFKDSLYFSAISLTSRGFTDKYPTTWVSILFSIFYLLIGVAFILYSFSTLIGYYVAFYQNNFHKTFSNILDRFRKKKKKTKGWVNLKFRD